ncbi:MAG: hypothetical protein ABEJ83_04765 [Candidatus Nanohaloarchaea archaeon]
MDIPPVQKRGSDWEIRGTEKEGWFYRRALVVTDLPEKIEENTGSIFKIQHKFPSRSIRDKLSFESYDKSQVREDILTRMSALRGKSYRQREKELRGEFETLSMLESTSDLIGNVSESDLTELSIYFEIRAPSKEELDKRTKYVRKASRKKGFKLSPIQYRSDESLLTNAPLGIDAIEYYVIASNEAIAGILADFHI